MAEDDELVLAIQGVIRYAQVSERIRATIASLQAPHSEINSLVELDPELAPELMVVAESLASALEALDRAFTFATARFDVQLAKGGQDA